MARSRYQLFDRNGAQVFDSSSANSDSNVLRYAGRLDAALALSDLSEEFTTWITVASRRGEVSVTLTWATWPYNESATTVFTVTPGRPLQLESRIDHALSSVLVTPVNTSQLTNVEILAVEGSNQVNAPSGPFLILEASKGVTQVEFLDNVSSWVDVRPESGAPLPFNIANSSSDSGKPLLIKSDSDFNGKPSIQFTAGGGAGEFFKYSDIGDTFDFMQADAYTVLLTGKLGDTGVEQYLWDSGSVDDNYPGSRGTVDGGYRTFSGIIDDSNAYSATNKQPEELTEKPFSMIVRHDGSGNLYIWSEGRQSIVAQQALGTHVGNSLPLTIGGTESGDETDAFGGILDGGKLVDFRIYDRAISETEMEGYRALMTSTYGINHSPVQGFPLVTGSAWFARANRGINVGAIAVLPDVATLADTRPEFAWGLMTTSGTASTQFREKDAAFNGEPSVAYDGVDNYATPPGTLSNLAFLSGLTPGFTIGMVMRLEDESENPPAPTPILSANNYNDASFGGPDIVHNPSIGGVGTNNTYELIDTVGGEMISGVNGASGWYGDTIAFIFRVDGSRYNATEINLTTGETFTTSGTYPTTSPGVQAIPTYMGNPIFIGPGPEYSKGAIAEQFLDDRYMTDDEVSKFQEYAERRYGA